MHECVERMVKRGYKINKTDNGEYYFSFYPHSPMHQEVGRSPEYGTNKKCYTAMLKFDAFIKSLSKEEIKNHVVIKKEECGTKFYFIQNNKVLFYRNSPFNGFNEKQNCMKCIDSVIEHIDEYTEKERW